MSYFNFIIQITLYKLSAEIEHSIVKLLHYKKQVIFMNIKALPNI